MKTLRRMFALMLCLMLVSFVPALAQDDMPLIGIIQLVGHRAG